MANRDDATPPADPSAASPNPAIGTPHLPHIERPPAVIHALGDARPGEANPTANLDPTNEETTATLLDQRETAEAALIASGHVREHGQSAYSYTTGDAQDEGGNVTSDNQQPGGRPNFSGVSEVTPLEYMESPHGYTSMVGQAGALDDTLQGRLDAKAEANANAIEHAESTSGVTYREGGNYEHREFENPAPMRDDVLSGAGTGISPEDTGTVYPVSAVFPRLDQAQAAVHALMEVGFTTDNIALVARQMDEGNAPAGADEVIPAGEDAVRRSSTELPNDEDLATTYEMQADVPADQMADSSRVGLSRDEGQITRIDAPADPEIYSDRVDSDADYRTTSDEGAAQAGEQPPTIQQDRTDGDVPVMHLTAQSGAIAGGLTGLVAGLAALAIPGIGPIIAIGPIAGALIGLLAGGVTGGLLGALLDVGVPEEAARSYAGRIEQGYALVTVQTDRVTRPVAVRILESYGGEDVLS